MRNRIKEELEEIVEEWGKKSENIDNSIWISNPKKSENFWLGFWMGGILSAVASIIIHYLIY